MLGSANSKTLIRTADSIRLNSKATFEWNHNNYNRPRVCGSVVNDTANIGSAVTSNLPLFKASSNFVTLTALGTWSQLASLKGGDTYTYSSSLSSKTSTPLSTSRTFAPLFTFVASRTFAYKFSFFIKSNDNTSENIMLRFTEYNNTTALGVGITRSFSMNSIQWLLKKITYNPINSSTNKVLVEVASEQATEGTTTPILISDITGCVVTKYEYENEGIYNIEGTFDAFRPGDEIAEQGLDKELSSVIYKIPVKQVVNGTYTQPSLVTKMTSSSATTPMYLPGLNSLTYYACPMTSFNVSTGIFAYYDKKLTTNKIVVKMLNSGPSTINSSYMNTIIDYTLWVCTDVAGTLTWTAYAGVGTMNKNGSLIVYYNGTTWTGTQALSTIDESTFTLTNTVDIVGVAFTVNKIGHNTAVLGGSGTLPLSQDGQLAAGGFDSTLRFLEVSPRLAIDMSNYIETYSISKETDSGDMPTAVGLANANSCSITLDNLPRIYNSNTISIFSDKTGTSPITKLGLVDKNVKVRIKYDLLDASGSTVESDLPLFVGYAESWDIDEDSAEINLFDYAKILQRKNTNSMLLFGDKDSLISLTVGECVRALFEQNGFSDYNTFQLNPVISENALTAYYTDNQKNMWESIQELLLPYSYLGFFDEYGMFNITNFKTKSSNSEDFVFTDTTGTYNTVLYKSNVVSLKENAKDRIGKVIVNYNSIYKKHSTDPASSGFTTVERPSTQVFWQAGAEEGVGFSNLRSGITESDTIIPLNQNLWVTEPEMAWVSYNGYAVIGTEIIKYNGIEIEYPLTASITAASSNGTTVTYTAKNNFSSGQTVTITGLTASSLNLTGVTVASATTTQFTVTNSVAATTAAYPQSSTATITSTLKRAVVKSQADLQNTLAKLRGTSQSNSTLTWRYTGRLMNAERGMFGTKAQYHVAPSNIANITSTYSELGVNTANFSTTSTSIPVANKCTIGLKDNISYMYVNGTDASLSTIAYFNQKDSSLYDNYMFTFYIPQTDSTDKTDDNVVIALGYAPATPSASYRLIISAVSNNKFETALWYGSAIVAKSTFKMDTRTPAVTRQVTTKKKKKKTVVDKKAIYDKLKTVYIHIDSNKNMEVTVDGQKITWYWKDGKTTRQDPTPRKYKLSDTFSRDTKSIAIGAYGANTVAIDSVTAWEDGSFALSPKFGLTVDSINILHGGVANVNRKEPYFFGINPSVFGMQIYNIDLESGPAYSQKIVKTTGAHEFKDGAASDVTRVVKVNEEQSAVSPIVGNSYKSKFMYINVGENFIPLSGSGSGTFNSTKVYGNALLRTGDIQYTAESDRLLPNDSEIQISSDWIQDRNNAIDVAALILNNSLLSGNTLEIEAFGNPLVTIGDIVNVKYYKTNTVSNSKYMVVGTKVSFNNGFDSAFTLRKIT